MGTQQHFCLVHLVTDVTLKMLAFYMGRLVYLQSALRDKTLGADAAHVGFSVRVQHHVHLQTVVVRETLVTNGALELFPGAVDSLGVHLQVVVGQVGFVALLARVRTNPFVLQHVEFQAVVETELGITLRTFIGLDTTVQTFLVVVHRALRRERLSANITRKSPFLFFTMSVNMLLKSSPGAALLPTLGTG